MLKRLISISLAVVLCVTMLLPICTGAVSANEDAEFVYINVQKKEKGSDGHYVTVDDPEYVKFMVKNGCVLADLVWLTDMLDLSIDIRNPSQSVSNAEGSSQSGNRFIPTLVAGYEKAFNDTADPEGYEFYIRKPDTVYGFYLRETSDKAYMYSPFLGEITADLGAPLTRYTEEDQTFSYWVPLVMFLNLFDSFCSVSEDTLELFPCTETVVDLLHHDRNELNDYYYSVYDDSGWDDWAINVKVEFNDFYNRVKNLFHNSTSLNVIRVPKAFGNYDEKYGKTIAFQFCTLNQDQTDAFNTTAAVISDAIPVEIETWDKGVMEKVVQGIQEQSKEASNKALQAFEEAKSGFITLDEYNKIETKAYRTAIQSGKASSLYTPLKTGMASAQIVLPAFLQYISTVNEIGLTNQTKTEALLTFLNKVSARNETFSSKEFLNSLTAQSQLYDGKDTNIFSNEELMDVVGAELFSGTTSQGITLAVDLLSESLLYYQIIDLGWTVLQEAVNGATGGAFTSLDAITNALYVDTLQIDTKNVLDDYLIHDVSQEDLDTYRQLEWTRLMSYYLVRKEVIDSYAMEQGHALYEEAMSVMDRECKELMAYMATLLYGPTGVTHSSLDCVYESRAEQDEVLLAAAISSEDYDSLMENKMEAVFGELPMEFVFTWGVGGWMTSLTLYEDGTFDGQYIDADFTTTYISTFNGRFNSLEKVSDDTYVLGDIQYETEETMKEWYDGGIQYIATDPLGLYGVESFTVYLPGKRMSEIPEVFMDWLYLYTPGVLPSTLQQYILCDETNEVIFIAPNTQNNGSSESGTRQGKEYLVDYLGMTAEEFADIWGSDYTSSYLEGGLCIEYQDQRIAGAFIPYQTDSQATRIYGSSLINWILVYNNITGDTAIAQGLQSEMTLAELEKTNYTCDISMIDVSDENAIWENQGIYCSCTIKLSGGTRIVYDWYYSEPATGANPYDSIADVVRITGTYAD